MYCFLYFDISFSCINTKSLSNHSALLICRYSTLNLHNISVTGLFVTVMFLSLCSTIVYFIICYYHLFFFVRLSILMTIISLWINTALNLTGQRLTRTYVSASCFFLCIGVSVNNKKKNNKSMRLYKPSLNMD